MKFFAILLLFISGLVHADSVLVYNLTTNSVVLERNPNQQRSIASITKIMTAMTALDYDKDLTRKLRLSRAVKGHLPPQTYTRAQLLYAMLINSDNAAAETLAEDFPGGRSAFITTMNIKAHAWDLKNTHFVDPSGLSPFNVSTVHDVAEMMYVSSGYWFVRDASAKKQVVLDTKSKKKIRTVNLQHTSGPLLFAFDHVVVSKTGLTNAAGWCVGMVVEQNNQNFAVVVLGAKNKAARLKTVKDIRFNHVGE